MNLTISQNSAFAVFKPKISPKVVVYHNKAELITIKSEEYKTFDAIRAEQLANNEVPEYKKGLIEIEWSDGTEGKSPITFKIIRK